MGKEISYETLAQATEVFLGSYCIEMNLTAKTVKNKRNFIRRLLTWLDGKSLTLQNARFYISSRSSLGIKMSSVLSETKQMKALVNFLFDREYIENNWSRKLINPKVHDTPPDIVSVEIAEKIIEAGTEIGIGDRSRSRAIKANVRLGLKFALRHGLRISELLAIRGNDLKLDNDPPALLVHGKGGDTVLFPMALDMVEPMRKRMSFDRVFTMTSDVCNRSLQRGAKKLSISIRVHNHLLRHIYCSTLANNNVGAQLLKRLMRHKDIRITDKYYTHFAMQDIALTLNSQKFVTNGLLTEQVLDLLAETIRKTKVSEDSRFTVSMTRNEQGLSFTVMPKAETSQQLSH